MPPSDVIQRAQKFYAQQQYNQRQPNLIESIGQGLTSPFRNLAQLGGEYADLGLLELTGGEMGSATPSASALTQPEFERYKRLSSTPLGALQFGGQTAASLGSYFIPAAKGMNTLIGAGLSGGSGGFGMSEGEDIGTLAKDTGIGVGAGMLTYGAGKLAQKAFKPKTATTGTPKTTPTGELSKLRDAEWSVKQDALGIKTKGDVTGFNDARQLTQDVERVTNAFGKNPDPKGINYAYDQLKGTLKDQISANPDKGLSKFHVANRAYELIRTDLKTPKKELIADINRILGKGKNISPTQMIDLKSDNFIAHNKIFNNDLITTPSTRIRAAIHDVADDYLKNTLEGNAGTLYNDMRVLHQAAKYINPALDKAETITIGATRIPTGGIQQKLQYKIGQGLGKVADVTEGKGLGNVIPKLGISANIPNLPSAAYPLAGSIGVGLANQPQPEVPITQQGTLPDLQGQQEAEVGLNAQPPIDEQTIALRDTLALKLMNSKEIGGKTRSYDEAMNVANLMIKNQTGVDLGGTSGGTGTTKKMTEKDKAFKSAGILAREALNLLDNGVATGKFANIGQGISEFFGTSSPEVTTYRSYIANARTALRNAMLGANMSPKEMESLAAAIPSFTDEPAIARQKLTAFIHAMDVFVESGDASSQPVQQQPIY